jgi:hypothetical protein
MDTGEIISALDQERDRLTQAINAFDRKPRSGQTPGTQGGQTPERRFQEEN